MSGANNWMSIGAGGLYGTNTDVGGGGGGLIQSRSVIDYLRIGSPGRTPDAEYPSGYLGTFRSRRAGRLDGTAGSTDGDPILKKIGSLNKRSYTRGTHVGERVDPGDYIWPESWRPDRGIKAEKRGRPMALMSAQSQEARLVHGGTALAPPIEPRRAGNLRALAPMWR